MDNNMKDVAEEAGVSITTVSHVINNTRKVSEETKQKVIKAMNKLNYQPNYVARSLRSKKSNIIGLLISNISNFFFTGVAKKVENILNQKGYNLIFGDSDENLEKEIKQINYFNGQMIDGLIMAPTDYHYDYYNKHFKNSNYPVVIFDCKPKNYKGDAVLVDNVQGSYKAVERLIQKGHKKIGLIAGGLHLTTSRERIQGYKKALTDHGIDINNSYTKIGDCTSDENGYRLTKEIIEKTDVTALFVINDLMTIGTMKFLKEKNIKIPEQISIIGFDDFKWPSITNPPLSVVKQPVTKIGEKVSELILKRIEENNNDTNNASKKRILRLKTQLIIRESC